MEPLGDQELGTAIENADSLAWSVRGAAGRQLASSDKIEEVADVLHRLLLDARNTWVIQETAEALLERKDTIGLRYVLLAYSQAGTHDAVDHLGAALDCNPEWMTTEGADRLIKQYRELAADPDASVRDEAQQVLAKLRPREEWARDSTR
ncbi:hypothetical protein ACIG0C_33365 [Kitasatospora aureofaciens]|uniref:PBS lyase n=1 Tax=Kitasatospora aureofaciens TaxID=1894 RepID=A0A1E7NEJ7_KITAU|nr:hypothetical protein [Kitasatospora aureofaciens]OEV39092.1 hypothetical protein HS99_0018580 [Kitasatospora aureofaciens]GGV04474.1 hypothetical protein GCM10010502_69000 [Kitasatospora aureofaciens]